jgi:addiction module HigA family antidote
MRLKNWCTGKLAKANLKVLGLRGAEAAKAIGVMRQQLYKVSDGANAVTPEVAVRLAGPFGGGADLWLRIRAAHDLAKVRQSEEKIAGQPI